MVVVQGIDVDDVEQAQACVEFRPLCAKDGKSKHSFANDIADAPTLKRPVAGARAAATLLSLPVDVKIIAFSFLDATCLANVGRTCKSLHNLPQYDRLWKVLLFRDFALLRMSRTSVTSSIGTGANDRSKIKDGPETSAFTTYMQQLGQVRARRRKAQLLILQKAQRVALQDRQSKVQRAVRMSAMRVPCVILALCLLLSIGLLHKYLQDVDDDDVDDSEIGAWEVAYPLLLGQTYLLVVWVASLLLLRHKKHPRSILGSVWERHNGLVKEWATLLNVKPLIGWIFGIALLVCSLSFTVSAVSHIAAADEFNIRIDHLYNESSVGQSLNESWTGQSYNESLIGQTYNEPWAVAMTPLWVAELVVIFLIAYKARKSDTLGRRLILILTILALVVAQSILLALFLDNVLQSSLAIILSPLWLLELWALVEPPWALWHRWKYDYESEQDLSVGSLMIGRAIALAPGIALQVMLCMEDAKGRQIYSVGELLAPIYLWSVLVALSLFGQACEYTEDSSNFLANEQVGNAHLPSHQQYNIDRMARRATSTPNLMIRSPGDGRISTTGTSNTSRFTRNWRRGTHENITNNVETAAPSTISVLSQSERRQDHGAAGSTGAQRADGLSRWRSHTAALLSSSASVLDSPSSSTGSNNNWAHATSAAAYGSEFDVNQLRRQLHAEESRVFRPTASVEFGNERETHVHDGSWLSMLSDPMSMSMSHMAMDVDDMELAQALSMSIAMATTDTTSTASDSAEVPSETHGLANV